MVAAVITRSLDTLKSLLPAKGKAAGIHVSISLAIFFVLLYLIAFKWYPFPYFSTDGGWQGIRIVFGVDVVLGPVLTFVVFNPAKRRREIIRDLSFIGLLQLCALSWGIHTVYTQRPVAVVELEGTFSPVIAEQYEAQKLSLKMLKQYDAREPAVIYQRIVGDDTLASFILARQGVSAPAQTKFYARFDASLPAVFSDAAKYEARTVSKRPELKTRFAEMRARYGADAGFLLFRGRYADAVIVVTRSGALVDSFRL